MRVTQSAIYRSFLSDIETLNESFNRANREVSSGKKLTRLMDSPAGSAELSSLAGLASKIDQYKSNINDASHLLRLTESILNEAHNLVTTIYTRGSEAASGSVSPDVRAMLAAEIRSLRDQILSLANTQVQGRYLFSGSRTSSAAFALAGDSVSYQGDDDGNSIRVDDAIEVQLNFPGAEVFDSIFSSIGALLVALDANETAGIRTSLGQFSAALSGLSLVRGKVGASLNMLENAGSRLEARATSLKERKAQIEDADLVDASVRLRQAQTALNASLAAGGSVLSQPNLFDILG